MHYCGYIITNKIPTKEEIRNILKPYDENENDNLEFAWDWYGIGGRYGGKLKIKFNPDENEDGYYSFKDRNYKYFISNELEEIKQRFPYFDEIRHLIYMGLKDKILYVDGAYYKDIINFDITNCYFVIDENQKLYVRELWKNREWIENKEFEENIKKLELKDKFITVIDLHD